MTGETHEWVGGGASCVLSLAVGMPLGGVWFAGVVAWRTSRWPDKMERPFRARHRTWTHWLLTGFVVALLIGAGIVAGGLEVAHLLHVDAGTLVPYLVALAFLVSIGVLCGWSAHTVADAYTKSGSPLWGPFSRRPVHLVRKRWRVRTGGRGDELVRLGAVAVVLGVLYVRLAL